MFKLRTNLLIASALLAGVMVLPGTLATPAFAADDAPPSGFPSWQDVQKSKASESSKAAEVSALGSLLDGLQAQSDQLGNTAVQSGAEYAVARSALETASAKVDVLREQVRRADVMVNRYKKETGALAAQSYRSGGANLSLLATLDAVQSQDGLQGLNLLHVVADNTVSMYNDSKASQSTAEALTAAEQTATAERERLAAEAKQKLDAAVEAQKAMDAQVVQQKQQSAVLVAQLASLKNTTVAVESHYHDGQVALANYESAQEAKRRAAAERARQEAAAAAARAVAASAAADAADAAAAARAAAASAAADASDAAAIAPAPQPGQASPQPAVPDPGSGYIPVNVLLPNIPGNGVNDPSGAQAYARGRLGAYGWGQGQFQCLVQLWNQESSWQTNATNPTSGAYGIAQALLPSKYASSGSDWLTSYRTQINWGFGYIRDRYGSPCGAWSHEGSHSWY